MNIFILHKNPKRAAVDLCDQHIVKMILESAQMLCSAFPNNTAPYKRAYYNHPCTVWTRTSKQNYKWLLDHADELCAEYTRRYSKRHKSQKVINWCRYHLHKITFPKYNQTPFAQAMPDDYKNNCAVTAYRNYYKNEKLHFAKWKNNTQPLWL
tara:strand:+ start:1039 stop:1497 length:459 start_codon:yes stop_codon:yes gene_type:complete